MRHNTCAYSLGFVFFAVAQAAFGQVPATSLAPEVRTALQEHSRLLTPLTIEWEMRRDSRHALDHLLKMIGFPDQDRNFLEPVRELARYQEGKVLLRTRYSAAQVSASPRKNKSQRPSFVRLVPATQEFAYDGSKCYHGSPDLGKVLGIRYLQQAVKEYGGAQLLRSVFFSNAGLAAPNKVADIAQGLTSPRSRVIQLLEGGGTLDASEMVDLDGIQCLRVTIRSVDHLHSFFLDPSLRYATRRYELARSEGADRRVIQIATADQFTELDEASGFSLPTKCRVDYFQFARSDFVWGTKPLFTERYTVTRLEREPIDEREFVLVYATPGTYIGDGTLPGAESAPEGRIEYEVPVDPRDLDRVIELAIKKYVPQESLWLRFSVWTFTAGVVVFVIWTLYRRRMSS